MLHHILAEARFELSITLRQWFKMRRFEIVVVICHVIQNITFLTILQVFYELDKEVGELIKYLFICSQNVLRISIITDTAMV